MLVSRGKEMTQKLNRKDGLLKEPSYFRLSRNGRKLSSKIEQFSRWNNGSISDIINKKINRGLGFPFESF
jgi:hypothetical protein